eukprot:213701_1
MAAEQKHTEVDNVEEDLTYFELQRIINNSNKNELIYMKNVYEKQLIEILQCYQKNKKFEHQIQRRINKFVFSPGIPYPYNCNKNNRHALETYLEHIIYSIELIKGAKETVRLLGKQKKGNYCPYLLFIPMSNYQKNYYNYNSNEKHMLSTYASKIIKESQHALEFHITSHGNHDPPSIDTINPITELLPNEFAIKFNTMIVNANLDKILKFKKIIKFIFHICNGAYCEINDNDEIEIICDKIKNESFIGQFRAQMIKFGYNNIIITGYRGYYQTMISGSGIRVGNKLYNSTKDVDCKQVQYTIYSNGMVDIPKCYNFKIESETEYESDTESIENEKKKKKK